MENTNRLRTAVNILCAIMYLCLAIFWYFVMDSWLSTVLFLICFILFAVDPVVTFVAYIRDQIHFRKVAKRRRARYEAFRQSVKANSPLPDEFVSEAKEVIK